MLGFDAIGRLALGQLPRTTITYVLTADTGVFALTGNAALFAINFVTVVGSFVLTGLSTTFTITMSMDTGSYLLTGNAVEFSTTMRKPLYLQGAGYWRGVT